MTRSVVPSLGGRRRLARGESRQLLLLAIATAAVLAWVPWLRLVGFPFRMLATLVHELGHGLAALLTGGEFLRFVIRGDGSGVALTAGGWRAVVIPAGYLGVALFASALVLLGARPRAARWALAVLGLAVALLVLRFGLPSVGAGEVASGLLAVASGIGWGAVLLAVALRAGDRLVAFAVLVLAASAAFTAVSDLWTLIGLSQLACGPATDARSMAELTLIPAVVWAVIWALLAAVTLTLAVRRAW
ncbi:MAG: M50 family metallopeptidase [Acidobacteria bacterium]|nr:M50 family metallopeptidase [Acidobacteriota bacterium]